MKKLFRYKILSLILVAFVFSAEAKRRNNEVEKKRVIEKGYSVRESVRLNIINSFGTVHVNSTNSGNEINVRVEVIARKKNEERAMELLENIEIDIREMGSEIVFETIIEGNLHNKTSESFEVNYQIDMPRVNPLKLSNNFGDVYVADFDSECDIKVSYGDARISNLNGESKFKISFGDADVERIALGEIEVKYSDANFDDLGIVRFKQGFSTVDIQRANTIDITSKYGAVNLGVVKGMKGSLGFSDFTIDYLLKELMLETSYANGFEVKKVSKNFTNIDLNGKFGGYTLNFEDGTNADFAANVKFCEFDVEYSPSKIKYNNQSDMKGEFKGSLGNGGGGKVQITSSYGDVNLR